jgi:hypothetical protein
MPGAQEGAVAPKLYLDNNMKTWEHISSFGPVPASQAGLGAETCAKLNTMDLKFVANGYHSRAQGLDGRTLPGGGFYCVRQ